MPKIRIAETAGDDLEDVWEYVAQDNPGAARKVIKEITGKFKLLRDHPQIGREENTLLDTLRSFPISSYIVLYKPFENGVEILRILHAARDIERILGRFIDSP
jgi:toxin ParE1/3/4